MRWDRARPKESGFFPDSACRGSGVDVYGSRGVHTQNGGCNANVEGGMYLFEVYLSSRIRKNPTSTKRLPRNKVSQARLKGQKRQ